jgi:hypothetical protein
VHHLRRLTRKSTASQAKIHRSAKFLGALRGILPEIDRETLRSNHTRENSAMKKVGEPRPSIR